MMKKSRINFYRNRFDSAIKKGRPNEDYINYTVKKGEHKRRVDFNQQEVSLPTGQIRRMTKELIRSKTIFFGGNKTKKQLNFSVEFHHKDVAALKHLLTKNLALDKPRADVFTNLAGKLHISPGAAQHIAVKQIKGGRLLTTIILKEKGLEDQRHVFESTVKKPIIQTRAPLGDRINKKIAGIKAAFLDTMTTYREQRAAGKAGFRGVLDATKYARDLALAKADARLAEKNFRYEMDSNALRLIVNDETTYKKDPTRWKDLSRRINLSKKMRSAGMTDEFIYLHHKHASGKY